MVSTPQLPLADAGREGLRPSSRWKALLPPFVAWRTERALRAAEPGGLGLAGQSRGAASVPTEAKSQEVGSKGLEALDPMVTALGCPPSTPCLGPLAKSDAKGCKA